MDDPLLWSSEDFKALLLSSNYFTEDERDQINRSDVSFMNIRFGATPNGMTRPLFVKIMRLDQSWFDYNHSLPLLPSVQSDWTGEDLADWLVTAEIVGISKRQIISEKLNGNLFRQGRVLGVLTPLEVKRAISRLNTKLDNLSRLLWNLFEAPSDTRTAIGLFLNIDFEKPLPQNEFEEMFMNKFTLTLPPELLSCEPEVRHAPNYDAGLAFEQAYLKMESIAHSFVGHIVRITTVANPDEYFASYTFVGQSSSMGKSRLLSESLMDGGHALFIFQINCRPINDRVGFPYSDPETDKVVKYITQLRTQGQMANFLLALLYIVFSKAFNDNFLVNTEKLSLSMVDLGITFDEVHSLSICISLDPNVISFEGIKAATSEMKLRRPDGRILKVIPVVALDEAAILVKTNFFVQYDVNDPSQTSDEINSFRLIRRVLNTKKKDLWGCPFVFAGTNTRFVNFVPPWLEDSSVRKGYGPDDAVASARKLIDPYVLTLTFNVFAKEKNRGIRGIGNWKEYIYSNGYSMELCNFGRPLWGAMLQAELSQGVNPGTSLDAIFSQASEKLVYVPPSSPSDKSLDRTASAMAIAGILAGTDWSTEKCATDLIEKKMAFLFKYDREGHKLYITYPPEPVLAMVALTLLLKYPGKILEDLETAEGGVFSRCIGTAGALGEFAVKILFLLCSPPPDIKNPRSSARDLFRNLLGEENMKTLERSATARILLRGSVCFSYFATFKKVCNYAFKNLACMVLLNAALSMPMMFPGVDMLIPVVLDNGQLGSINIQVKNNVDPLSGIDTIKNKLYHELISPDIPRLNMIISVGPELRDKFEIHNDVQGTTIIMEGWKTCFGATCERHPSLKHPLHTLLSVSGFNMDYVETVPFECDVNNVDEMFPDC